MTGQRGTEPAGERARLVEAAIAIARVRGFADTTVEMVVERADLDRPAFEKHFASLEDCFLVGWDLMRAIYMGRARAAYEAESAWLDQIRALVGETIGCLQECPDEARLLAVEVLELGKVGRERLERLVDELARLVDAGRQELADPGAVPPSTALAIVGGAYHRLTRVLRAGGPSEADSLRAELVCFAVMPYLGIEAGLAELANGSG